MFDYIKGVVAKKRLDSLTIEINSIGYKVLIPLSTYHKIESEFLYTFYIYEHIREDCFQLYGFLEEKERDMFIILVNANGVGPKIALAILSTFTISDISEIVYSEDIKRLTSVPGLGEKKAQKLYLDIKDKVKAAKITFETLTTVDKMKPSASYEEDIYLALESLGYKGAEISKVLKRIDLKSCATIEEALKKVLKEI
ncbi:MAG: Holliday junction branch migration protein RuvA [Fusobacteria bacterium]|nr:Holliday junction branch migration protein RuvA [Fusobacteriota bacterium]